MTEILVLAVVAIVLAHIRTLVCLAGAATSSIAAAPNALDVVCTNTKHYRQERILVDSYINFDVYGILARLVPMVAMTWYLIILRYL